MGWSPKDVTDETYVELREWFVWYHKPYLKAHLKVDSTRELTMHKDLFEIISSYNKKRQRDNSRKLQARSATAQSTLTQIAAAQQ